VGAREGFTRIRTILKIVGGLWLVPTLGFPLVAVYSALQGNDVQWVEGVLMYLVYIILPAIVVWVVFWVVEGFFVDRSGQ